MIPSPFNVLGIGVVTENKPSGEFYASVFLLEQSQLADPDINSNAKQDFSFDLFNGTVKQVSIKEDYKVKAKWLRIGDSQRITPPDLTINQKVLVLNKPGYDEYYWIKIFEENSILVNENVTYGFMARNPSDKATVDPGYLEHMYRLSISTEEGEIRFTTTDAAGEKSTYTLLVDTKNGILGYSDKQGNYSLLYSQEGINKSNYNKDLGLQIGGGNYRNIGGDNVSKQQNVFSSISGSTLLKHEQKLDIQTNETLSIEDNGELNLKIVKDIQAKTLGNIILNSNQDVHILNNGGKTTIISPSSVSIVAPQINLVGSVQCGTLSCVALSVGGAAPTPPTLTQPNIPSIDTSEYDEAMEKLNEMFKDKESNTSEDGTSSGSTRGRNKDEGKDDPWDNETKPSEPEPLPEPEKSVSTMEKESEFLAQQGLTIKSDTKIICQSNGQAEFSGMTTKLSGTTSMEIIGVSGDLTDVLFNAIDSICKIIDTPVPVTGTAPAPGSFTGVTVPTGAGSSASSAIKLLLQTWKGGGAKTSNFRARSLGLPETPPMDLDKFNEELKKILDNHANTVQTIMKTIDKENGDDNSSN